MIESNNEQKIKDSADIIDIIGSRIELRRRGSQYKAPCPFHGEKTASFNVNPQRGIYKCFGCGVSGDAIKFVMEYDKVDYREALIRIAERNQIEVIEDDKPDLDSEAQKKIESEIIVLEAATKFYESALRTPDSSECVEWLRSMGVTGHAAKAFRIGCFPNGDPASLLRHLSERSFSHELIQEVGLVHGVEQTDRSRSVVTLPIQDTNGSVVALSIIPDPHGPRYDVRDFGQSGGERGQIPYGLFQAKGEIRSSGRCYILPGYVDTLLLHSKGVINTVSPGGSVTAGMVNTIFKYCKEVTFIYEGTATLPEGIGQSVSKATASGLNARAVILPIGHTIHSFFIDMKGDEIKAYIKANEKDIVTLSAENIPPEGEIDPEVRTRLITGLVEKVLLIPDLIKREVFLQHISNKFDVSREAINSQIKNRE